MLPLKDNSFYSSFVNLFDEIQPAGNRPVATFYETEGAHIPGVVSVKIAFLTG